MYAAENEKVESVSGRETPDSQGELVTPEETENRADDRTHKSHNSQNTVADEGPEIRVITDGAETKAMLDELSTAPYIGLE